jgi:hypothetical protein
MVQKLWLDINAADIDAIEDREEGGFLGIGKDDILEITCSGQAPVSQARFHLDGQDSADWHSEIRLVQTSDVAKSRHDATELEESILTFPGQCPNCMAPLPEVTRGVTQIKCEFCGTLVGPEKPAE